MVKSWIKGYAGYYQVTTCGKIISVRRNLIMKGNNTGKGYLKVDLKLKGKRKSFYIHRLVAKHFVHNPNKYKDVNHKDGNKQNNNFTNLEWCNRKENIIHSYKKKLQPDRRITTKNDRKLMKELRKLNLTYKQISEQMGFSETCVYNAINNRNRYLNN